MLTQRAIRGTEIVRNGVLHFSLQKSQKPWQANVRIDAPHFFRRSQYFAMMF
jgi:hypothetical protein